MLATVVGTLFLLLVWCLFYIAGRAAIILFDCNAIDEESPIGVSIFGLFITMVSVGIFVVVNGFGHAVLKVVGW